MLTTETLSPPSEASAYATPKRVVAAVLWGCFAVLIAGFICEYSIHLAGVRIYHADECRSVCAAHFLTTGEGVVSGTPVSVFLLPLMWFGRGVTHSAQLYASARFFSTELFWLNLVLLTGAASGKLFSRRSIVALAGAATLAPLWDFGFEIRPDNLALAGLLLMWCVLRVRPEGIQSYFIAGLLASALQFVDIKTLVYSVPLSLAALVFPPPGYGAARGKIAVAWLFGAVVAVVLVRIGYGAAGLWSVYLQNWKNTLITTDEEPVGWVPYVMRLVAQVPLVLALAAAGVAALVSDVRRRGKRAFSWDGTMPEGLLFVLAAGVFIVNPSRSPHDLLIPVAFAFLLVARSISKWWKDIVAQRAAFGLIAAVVLFGHVVPFVAGAKRHLNLTNYHQETLMRLAEQMTEPGKDLVYDTVGIVPTRRSAEYESYFQRQNNDDGATTPKDSLKELLTRQPPSVIIADARFDQLSESETGFILQDYVLVSGDFWALGRQLPKGGGEFEVLHAGRYRITSSEASNLLGTYAPPATLLESLAPEPKLPPLAGSLDGVPLNGKPVSLTVGKHHLECAAGTEPAIVWLGPSLDKIARMNGGQRRRLFVNWY